MKRSVRLRCSSYIKSEVYEYYLRVYGYDPDKISCISAVSETTYSNFELATKELFFVQSFRSEKKTQEQYNCQWNEKWSFFLKIEEVDDLFYTLRSFAFRRFDFAAYFDKHRTIESWRVKICFSSNTHSELRWFASILIAISAYLKTFRATAIRKQEKKTTTTKEHRNQTWSHIRNLLIRILELNLVLRHESYQ